MLASKAGHTDIVKLLLADYRNDVNYASFGGKTALFYASLTSNSNESIQIDVMKLILRCPSLDLSRRDKEFKTPLDHAEDQNRTNMIEVYESRWKMTAQLGHTCCSKEVNDGLQKAAEDGDVMMVKAFLPF